MLHILVSKHTDADKNGLHFADDIFKFKCKYINLPQYVILLAIIYTKFLGGI